MLSDHVCEDHEFTCTNHKCVHLSLTCNGENDCGDNSDEEGPCKGANRLIICFEMCGIVFG